MQAVHPRNIGRFHLISVLGKGAQGKVYLAEDPHLQRNVAIKTMVIEEGSEGEKQLRTLLDEARIVSKLQHPNIVTLFDAGEDRGTPYLVFEYVEGTTLARLIKEQGILPVTQAALIATQVLDGMAYAHQKNVVHRDLKPGNVMIDGNGTARIMDFGIARALSSDKMTDTAFFGTPLYMAPEYISDKTFTPQSDVFSVGMMLYEMLAGAPPVKGSNIYETLHNIVNAAFAPPSRQNTEVDERLDDIVMKALSKKPENRYASAAEMSAALKEYLHPAGRSGAVEDASQSTVQFLLRRMQHKSDFPALSQTMHTINRVLSSDQEGISSLSNVILRDYALTNKLLRLVNTAYYGRFGGTISTISRAVVILGIDTIRNVAITLMLFEHLQNKAQAAHLKDEIVASMFSGIIARELVIRGGVRDAEESFICSMFHSLGRMLVAFYFTEEMQAICRTAEQMNVSEEKAAIQILGVSFEELGIAIARAWHFPEKIIGSMRHVTDERVRRPVSEEDRLQLVASLSNDLCLVARNTPAAQRSEKLRGLINRYSNGANVTERVLTQVVEESVKELARESTVLDFDVKDSPLFSKVSGWVVLSDMEDIERPVAVGGNDQLLDGTMEGSVLSSADPAGVSAAAASQPPPDAHAVLTAGIQDITNTLVSDYQLNDVLRIILETMYRGMGFTRVLLCVRDPKQGTMNARFGFGSDIDKIMPEFRFPTGYTPDVFHAALSQNVDIYISDVDAENIKARIPDWYRRLIPAKSFILFPVIVDKKPIGMFYGDKDTLDGLSIQPKELSLLKTLRNQAVLAIKQKY